MSGFLISDGGKRSDWIESHDLDTEPDGVLFRLFFDLDKARKAINTIMIHKIS